MEVIAHERSTHHEVFVLRAGTRQIALVMHRGQHIAAEIVGCLSHDEEKNFVLEAQQWLENHGHTKPRHISGELAAIRPPVAARRATA
jgi:hypothetical protein